MMRFAYRAINAEGRIVAGTIEAEHLAGALEHLKGSNLVPFMAQPTRWRMPNFNRPINSHTFTLRWRAQFIQRMAALLGAGISLDRTLTILQSQSKSAAEGEFLSGLKSSIGAGHSLSVAFEAANPGFRADEVGLIKAGEQTGSLVPVLEELGGALEQRLQLKSRISSTLVYPAFLVAMVPVAVVSIAMVLVPGLEPLFEASHASMPPVLFLLSVLSSSLREHLVQWLGSLSLLSLGSAVLSRQPSARAFLLKTARRLPGIGTSFRQLETARICRSLGALLKGGASLQNAMAAAAEVTSSPESRAQVMSAREEAIAGRKLADALAGVSVLPSEALQMIGIGEESNRLESMLTHIADVAQASAERYIERLMTIAAPLLTVAVGAMIGGIVMSIMSAILSLNDMAIR